jgi:LysM repeat protein
MSKRTSAPARALAVIALLGGFAVLFIVVSTAMEGGDSGGDGNRDRQERIERKQKQRSAPATYTIEVGDTLTSISRETGVSIGQIERLNPEIDPQILVEGEKLKLK